MMSWRALHSFRTAAFPERDVNAQVGERPFPLTAKDTLLFEQAGQVAIRMVGIVYEQRRVGLELDLDQSGARRFFQPALELFLLMPSKDRPRRVVSTRRHWPENSR